MSVRKRYACILPCIAVLVLAAFDCADAEAQEADTVSYPYWEIDMTSRLSGSQAGYRNWTEGGINSLAAAAEITGTFERTSLSWLQLYDVRLAIGVVKQDTLDLRKADDVIRLKSQVSYRGDGVFRSFSPTVAADVRTQFAPGFNYNRNPFDDGRPLPVKVSDLFSPATFTQSLGLAHAADWGFRQRVGVASKETVVLIRRFRPLYGHVPSEAVRIELGIDSQTELDREVFDNVRLQSTLGLFAAFNQDNLPDLLWENLVTMQVNSWLRTDVEVVMLYDRDIRNAVQVKEVFSIGISIILI